MLWTAPLPAPKRHRNRLPMRGPGSGGAQHAGNRDIGFDIAKSVFQVHGVNAHGDVIVRRQLKRR